jgi:hypothetical protein
MSKKENRVSRHDSPEGDGPAPQRRHDLWSTVQAAITGGWAMTFRLLLILGILSIPAIIAGLGAGTPIAALLQLIQ